MNLKEKLEYYISAIKEAIDVDQIILFGSYAKGTYDKYSDIDIAVISKEIDTNIPRWENINLIKKKSNLRFDPDIQIIPFNYDAFYNSQNSPIASFIKDIKQTGKIVYSK